MRSDDGIRCGIVRRQGILLSMALALLCRGAAAQPAAPNPYGIAGWGVLDDLNMPADCLDYDWNGLHPGTLAQMCRPNHYYNYIGIAPRWWGYNEQTGEINDPARFAQWIADNPGRVWIIGNEPDLVSQDGLTREQYAQMYKTYHDFIGSRDATARFCIGAITGGSTAGALAYTTSWYQYVMNHYQNTYGEPMPIDLWNIHSYCGPTQIENPDQPIADFVIPFVNWCHTVDGGRYAGCEVWITELPVGEWMGALSEEWIIWFAQRYLPRLERAGINRWFWFVSRDSSEWATVALVKSTGVSPIGLAYADLARGFPNDVPPVTPYVPEPTPAYFADDFSSGTITAPWMIKAGTWAVESGCLRQSRVNYPWSGETCVLQHIYGDFDASLAMRINNAVDTTHWAGFLFHAAGRFDSHGNSGYLVFLRRNGAVGLYNRYDGTMREVAGAVADATQWQHVRVQTAGWRIQVWVNDSRIIDHTDANQRFAQGYTLLQAHKTDCSFDDVRIWNTANAPPTITSTAISATRLIADDVTPYRVALTARDADGGADVTEARVLLDDGTYASDHARGCLAWGLTDADIVRDGGAWALMGDALGGGRWGWRTDGWGADTYITPQSATMTVDGDRRIVEFVFTVKPAWAPATNQRMRGRVRDARGDATAWQLSLNVYTVWSTRGDFDMDSDVDLEDFALFQLCYNGPNRPASALCWVEADYDTDGDVDLIDFASFQLSYNGPNRPPKH